MLFHLEFLAESLKVLIFELSSIISDNGGWDTIATNNVVENKKILPIAIDKGTTSNHFLKYSVTIMMNLSPLDELG